MHQTVEYKYDGMEYKRSGRNGVLLPRMSPGLWQNLGPKKSPEEQGAVLLRAFDMGITRFDLANNYGFPAVGRIEENLGSALRGSLGRYKDELFISTKVGLGFWPGPYGNWGSREYLMVSLDSSLECMGLEYVDVFYRHRPDPETSLGGTMGALSDIVCRGKALYVRTSNYQAEEVGAAIHILRESKTPYPLHQPWYSMFEHQAEDDLLELLDREGVGCICHSPLAQGTLTGRYLNRIPEGSRASKKGSAVGGRYLTEDKLVKIKVLDRVTGGHGQSLVRMALVWVLRRREVTSALIGASSIVQLEDNIEALDNLASSREELVEIEGILKG